MKRDLSIILCILMIFSLCTYNVKANDNEESDEPKTEEVLETSEVTKEESETPKETGGQEIVIEESDDYEVELTTIEEKDVVEEEKTYLAQIGDNKYETLQDAIDASSNGDTITIINDVVFKPIKNEDGSYSGQGYDGLYTNGGQTCSIVGSNYCYPTYTFNRIKNKNITIDLNNKNISVDCDFAAYIYYFDIENNSNVTFIGEGIVDGNNSVGNSYNSPYLIYIGGNSDVTIDGGTYKSCTTVQVYSGTVNITGGHFGQDTTIKKVYYAYNKNDYFIKYLINCIDGTYKNGNAKVNITGGTFEIFNPANNGAEGANTNFVAYGYKSVGETKDNGEIWYTVVDGTVATVSNPNSRTSPSKYTSLQDAVDNASEGDTITLVEDIDLTSTLIVKKNVTLDLNGHTITNTKNLWNLTEGVNHWSLISIRENGNLTITGNGKLDAKENDCYAIDLFDDNVSLTIENGEFIGNLSCIYVYGGTLNINGGSFNIKQLYDDENNPYKLLINCLDESYKDKKTNVTISGGSFIEFDPSNVDENPNANYVPSGYKVNKETKDNKTWYTVSIDKDALKSALDTYTNTTLSSYCKDTSDAYTSAYNSALSVYNNTSATLTKVSEALTSLTRAYEALVLKELTHIEAKEATCTKEGNIEYYECTKCHRKYSNANGTNEITSDVVIKALGHDYKKIEAKEPTIGELGNIEYYRCGYCSKTFIKDGNNYVETTDITIDKVDTSKLDELLSKAITDLSKYTKSTADAYLKELNNAKTIRNTRASTSEDVASAISNLESATKALVEKTKASVPTFSLNEGTYTSAQELTITSSEGNKVIISVNGSSHTSNQIELTGEIEKKKEYIVSAYTVGDDDHLDSEEVTYTYIIDIVKGEIEDSNPKTDDKTKSLEPETSKIDTSVVELTEDEKKAIDNGKDIKVILSVEEAENKEELAKVNEVISSDSSLNTVSIVDISLSLTVEGDNDSRTISSTEKAIAISVKIAPEFINTNSDIQRTYQVIRTHTENGNISIKHISGEFDSRNNTFTFETDRFSTYALVYKDSKKETKSNTNSNTNSSVKTCEEAIGRNWTWSEKSKTCVYRVTNTNTK